MTEFGVYYTSGNPILCRISEDISMSELKEKIRQVTMNGRNILEICYRSPFLDKHGVVMYQEKYLCSDNNVRQMFEIISKFQTFIGPIELYVQFVRARLGKITARSIAPFGMA